jgi:hypothetical protein
VRALQKTYGMTGAMDSPLFRSSAGDVGNADGGGEEEEEGEEEEDGDGGGGAGRDGGAAPAHIVVRVGTAHRVFRVRGWDHLICLLVLFGCCWGAVFDLHPRTGKCPIDITRLGVAVVHGSAGGESNATYKQHLRSQRTALSPRLRPLPCAPPRHRHAITTSSRSARASLSLATPSHFLAARRCIVSYPPLPLSSFRHREHGHRRLHERRRHQPR